MSMDNSENKRPMDEARENLRQAVKDQLGTDNPIVLFDNIDDLPRFSPNLPTHYTDEEKASLLERANLLHPWLQGPFYLGGDLVIGGPWRIDNRWRILRPELPDTLAGQRVLDIGTNAGYDCFSFNLLQPDFTLGIDPEIFIEQAYFLNEIYRTSVKFETVGWQALEPARFGLFDLVHCNGVYYHEQNMVQLVQQLGKVTAPGGTLLLGGFVLREPEFTNYARFVSGSFWNDPTWWWVPGFECMKGILSAAGFTFVKEFGRWVVPNGDFPVDSIYFRAVKN